MTALLLFGDTERSPALRHEVPLTILDSLMFCERDGRRYVLAKHLERSRIERALPDAEIVDFSDFGMKELAESGLSPEEAEREVAVRVARHIALSEATIPGDFPVALADRLRQEGIHLRVDDRAVQRRRRSKASSELDGIHAAQRAAESGIRAAAQMLARARPGEGGHLYLDGTELLAEHVREAARAACAKAGAPAPAKTPARAFNSRSATASVSRSTKPPCSGSRAQTRSSRAMSSRSSPGCGTATSAACASKTSCS